MDQVRILLIALIATLAVSACYDIPITAKPTRRIDARLLGNWSVTAGEHIKIRQFDEWNYVMSYDGDLYRAHHSDVSGLSLLSVEKLQDRERGYLYFAWELSDDAQRLRVRLINPDLIPENTNDADTLVRLIERNRENPRLFTPQSSAFIRVSQ